MSSLLLRVRLPACDPRPHGIIESPGENKIVEQLHVAAAFLTPRMGGCTLEGASDNYSQ